MAVRKPDREVGSGSGLGKWPAKQVAGTSPPLAPAPPHRALTDHSAVATSSIRPLGRTSAGHPDARTIRDASAMSPFVPLPGSRKPPLPAASAVGPADAGEVVTVTVRLRSAGDPAALAATAYELGAAPLAERRYLTHDELWAAHGARREDVDAVERYARERGVAVVRSSAGERTVVLRGTLGDLLAMFPAEVEQHRYAMGSYRHVVGDVAVPAGLSGIVTGVFGLDTRPRFRTSHRRRARAVGRGDAPPVALDATPKSPGGASPTLVAATSYASRYRFPESAGGVIPTLTSISRAQKWRTRRRTGSSMATPMKPPPTMQICQ